MTIQTASRRPLLSATAPGRHPGDRVFRLVARVAALTALALVIAIAAFLIVRGWPALRHFRVLSFLHGARWAPSESTVTSHRPNPYGIVQFIYGTVLTAAIALAIAFPVAVGAALFVNELAPPRVRGVLVAITDVLAMVPSVVYGFWGVFALIPVLRPVVGRLSATLGPVPVLGALVRGPFFGFSYLTAALVLAVMITPIIAAVAREVIATTPGALKEGAYALGSTRWEMIRSVVLPHSRSGLVVAALLGLGRALGETIAVTMVIGNNVAGIAHSLLAQGATLASVIANEFTEANRPFHLSALFVVGAWLLLITFVVNAAARVIVARFNARNR